MLELLWSYVTLAVSVMFTQELGALVGGFAAEQGHLAFPSVVGVSALAVFGESVALYWLGRWRAAWVRLRLRKSPPIVKKLLSAMRWNPWRSTFVSRFAFGARIALPMACGAVRVPAWIFMTGTAVASVVWALVVVSLGWVFGQGAVLLVGEVKKYEGTVTVVLVVLVLGAFLLLKRRQRRASLEAAQATSSEKGEGPG
jgi:membrane protein DedA with SNARE-associated domain